MKPFVTTAMVLSRTDYGEADRILTVLTLDFGKLCLMAKGVRRIKSKLAGGVELFSVSQITFVRGRGDIGTLVSSRLQRHYGWIAHNIRRIQLGYELIRLLNKITEDETGPEYFALLELTFQALDDLTVSDELIRTWFYAQLLRLGGHSPNLHNDTASQRLQRGETYSFNFDVMSFVRYTGGEFNANHIQFLRLMFSGHNPNLLKKVDGGPELIRVCAPLVQTMISFQIRI